MADQESSTRSVDENDEDTSEAQAQVIASLRAQVTDLFSQVTQLNSKLVASYDRMSDLEDQLHDASSSLRNASVTISSLELERSHHLAALNTGLLVEKAHVTAELNRLMERATEEAAQRGQAESARHDIEKDLDDLSASLFDQANTMVAEARLGQARSERKVEDAERALRIAEDAVKDMQVQMQTMQTEKEMAERAASEARQTMGKGKWIEREDARAGVRFMTTHTPYTEFVAFITHVRGLRASQPTPPVMSTLLGQPFIARLITEDSEPTVRLDLAPSLNWLSRRSVLTAIHTGMLTVEPLPFSTLVQELHQHPQSISANSLSCALCGTLIARLPSTPTSRSNNMNGSWFKYPRALSSTSNLHSGNTTPPSANGDGEPPGQVYVFRLATPTTSTPPPMLPVHTPSASVPVVGSSSSRPHVSAIASSRVLQTQTHNSPYPLCTSNYCLTRLRSTCSLWAFVRVGIVERIWEEEVVQPAKPHANGETLQTTPAQTTTGQPASGIGVSAASEKPPVPPRRRRLWEMASALSERAVSWGKESGDSIKDKEKEKDLETDTEGMKKLPAPPPSHPAAPHSHPQAEVPASRVPPPLPKRSDVRGIATSDDVSSSSSTAPDKESKQVNGNGKSDKTEYTSASSSPIDETTFAEPLSSQPASVSHSNTPPAATEPTAPVPQSTSDSVPPPSPRAVPLPVTPTTPNPPSRAASPTPRPRSRLSSPASPPPPPGPGSRPASPALIRSRAGSPAPPSHGHAASPVGLHARGKTAASSPLALSRPASPAQNGTGTGTGVGAPPVPRRAAARRAVPSPPSTLSPTTGGSKSAGTGEGRVEGGAVVAGEVAVETGAGAGAVETKDGGGEGGGEVKVQEATADSAPVPPTESVPQPAKEAVITGEVESTETPMVVSDSTPTPTSVPASRSENGRTSLDTTVTKRSSSSEGEGYAGDATWEERTWKEVVRMKEDMFWARVGGVRKPCVG